MANVWEGLYETDERPENTDNIHCRVCLHHNYSQYSGGCPGCPKSCGIYSDIYGTWLNTPSRKKTRELMEKKLEEMAEEDRVRREKEDFLEAVAAYKRGEGFIEINPIVGGFFHYKEHTYSLDAVSTTAACLL